MTDAGIALVVAQRPDIQSQAMEELDRAGFTVCVEQSSSAAIKFLADQRVSLVIIAHPLGDESGIVLYRTTKHLLREAGSATTPVVVYVDHDHKDEVVTALESGVDDFILYPASPGVLNSRVRLIRSDAGSYLSRGRVHHGPVTIDLGRHEVYCGDRQVNLSMTEFFILTVLLRDPGRVWTRRDLLRERYGGEVVATERSIDVHVRALRRKLGACTYMIETVRGVGYRASTRSTLDTKLT